MRETSYLSELLDALGEHMTSLPGPFQQHLRSFIVQLEDLTLNARPPRFAVVGRRGSGKSTLLNAIFEQEVALVGSTTSKTGAGMWHKYDGERGSLEILDTRGLGEGSAPDEATSAANPLEEFERAVEGKCPDVLLFLVKGKEVDARIEEDILNLLNLIEITRNYHDYEPPVLGVVTQVDELDPPDVSQPPFDDEEKQENIDDAARHLRKQLSERMGIDSNRLINVIPVSAYMRFRNGKIVADRRWNVDTLLEILTEEIPESAQVELARLGKVVKAQKRISRVAIQGAAVTCSGIAALPIPLADIAPITTVQGGMIMAIAAISGRKVTVKTATEFIGAMGLTLATGIGAREIFRQLVKLIPGVGSLASSGVAYVATVAIGEAAIAYFIDNKSASEAKAIFEETKEKEAAAQANT